MDLFFSGRRNYIIGQLNFWHRTSQISHKYSVVRRHNKPLMTQVIPLYRQFSPFVQILPINCPVKRQPLLTHEELVGATAKHCKNMLNTPLVD